MPYRFLALSLLALLTSCGGGSDEIERVHVQCTTSDRNTFSTTNCTGQLLEEDETTAGTPAGTDRIISRL